jgi:hypothetical protein
MKIEIILKKKKMLILLILIIIKKEIKMIKKPKNQDNNNKNCDENDYYKESGWRVGDEINSINNNNGFNNNKNMDVVFITQISNLETLFVANLPDDATIKGIKRIF